MPGILRRYVIGQVLSSFGMALTAITGIFVLFMVMAEAAREGLAPLDIIRIVPFIIPSSLPYTIPVALLFAVSVVYGRMAGDNEIMAVKAAGCSVTTLLVPTWALGLAITGGLLVLSGDLIPRATHGFRRILFQDTEDMFYKFLKKEGQFNNPKWPFFIDVQDVQGRTLIGATFKHRKSKEEPNVFDLQVAAQKAWIHFLPAEGIARVELEQAETTGGDSRKFLFWIDGRQVLEYPLPKNGSYKLEKRIQELTNAEMMTIRAEMQANIRTERARQAATAAMWIASGRIDRVDWPHVGLAFQDFRYWERRSDELETEKSLRDALAWGSFCFVLLGAPWGVLLARRDFLSAFMTSFGPIIVAYYPVTLASVNLSKEGMIGAWIVFVGDVGIAVAAVPIWWWWVRKR